MLEMKYVKYQNTSPWVCKIQYCSSMCTQRPWRGRRCVSVFWGNRPHSQGTPNGGQVNPQIFWVLNIYFFIASPTQKKCYHYFRNPIKWGDIGLCGSQNLDSLKFWNTHCHMHRKSASILMCDLWLRTNRMISMWADRKKIRSAKMSQFWNKLNWQIRHLIVQHSAMRPPAERATNSDALSWNSHILVVLTVTPSQICYSCCT